MSASDSRLPSSSPLAAHLGPGARPLGAGLTLTERHDRSVALILTARDRVARSGGAFVDRIGSPLPADGGVSASEGMTVMSCGPGQYLAVSNGPYLAGFASELQLRLASLATVIDYSDQLAQLALSGSRMFELLARLCSIDFESMVQRPFAAVARVGMLRCHLWRRELSEPLMMAVQRSCAVSFLDALLRAAESVTAQSPCLFQPRATAVSASTAAPLRGTH